MFGAEEEFMGESWKEWVIFIAFVFFVLVGIHWLVDVVLEK